MLCKVKFFLYFFLLCFRSKECDTERAQTKNCRNFRNETFVSFNLSFCFIFGKFTADAFSHSRDFSVFFLHNFCSLKFLLISNFCFYLKDFVQFLCTLISISLFRLFFLYFIYFFFFTSLIISPEQRTTAKKPTRLFTTSA